MNDDPFSAEKSVLEVSHFDEDVFSIKDDDEPKFGAKTLTTINISGAGYEECNHDYQLTGSKRMYPTYSSPNGKFRIEGGRGDLAETFGMNFMKCWVIERIDVEPILILYISNLTTLDVPKSKWITNPKNEFQPIPTIEIHETKLYEDNEYVNNENLEHVDCWTKINPPNQGPENFCKEIMSTREWKYIGYFLGWRWQSVKSLYLDSIDMSQVNESIFIGNMVDACCWPELEFYGITHILNMAVQVPLAFPNKISYMHHKLGDIVSAKWKMLNAFNEGVEFIDEAVKSGGKVLIHCQQGISRACTISIAYFMNVHGLSFGEAYSFVKTGRPITNPNPGFLEALHAYETELRNDEN